MEARVSLDVWQLEQAWLGLKARCRSLEQDVSTARVGSDACADMVRDLGAARLAFRKVGTAIARLEARS